MRTIEEVLWLCVRMGGAFALNVKVRLMVCSLHCLLTLLASIGLSNVDIVKHGMIEYIHMIPKSKLLLCFTNAVL